MPTYQMSAKVTYKSKLVPHHSKNLNATTYNYPSQVVFTKTKVDKHPKQPSYHTHTVVSVMTIKNTHEANICTTLILVHKTY